MRHPLIIYRLYMALRKRKQLKNCESRESLELVWSKSRVRLVQDSCKTRESNVGPTCLDVALTSSRR